MEQRTISRSNRRIGRSNLSDQCLKRARGSDNWHRSADSLVPSTAPDKLTPINRAHLAFSNAGLLDIAADKTVRAPVLKNIVLFQQSFSLPPSRMKTFAELNFPGRLI